jgi:hypothetical protein
MTETTPPIPQALNLNLPVYKGPVGRLTELQAVSSRKQRSGYPGSRKLNKEFYHFENTALSICSEERTKSVIFRKKKRSDLRIRRSMFNVQCSMFIFFIPFAHSDPESKFDFHSNRPTVGDRSDFRPQPSVLRPLINDPPHRPIPLLPHVGYRFTGSHLQICPADGLRPDCPHRHG